MFDKNLNSKKQGDIGLGVAIAYYTGLGKTVCLPLTDNQDYDLVIDDGLGLKKVQVKTTSHRSRGSYKVDLRVTGGNSSGNQVNKYGNDIIYDILFVLTANGSKYVIPKEEFSEHKNSLTLGSKYEKYLVNGWAGHE